MVFGLVSRYHHQNSLNIARSRVARFQGTTIGGPENRKSRTGPVLGLVLDHTDTVAGSGTGSGIGLLSFLIKKQSPGYLASQLSMDGLGLMGVQGQGKCWDPLPMQNTHTLHPPTDSVPDDKAQTRVFSHMLICASHNKGVMFVHFITLVPCHLH
jgi:hypothetical protein